MSSKFDNTTIERNQKMIDEWKEELKQHGECAVMMFTVDNDLKIRLLRTHGVSDNLHRWILTNAIATLDALPKQN